MGGFTEDKRKPEPTVPITVAANSSQFQPLTVIAWACIVLRPLVHSSGKEVLLGDVQWVDKNGVCTIARRSIPQTRLMNPHF